MTRSEVSENQFCTAKSITIKSTRRISKLSRLELCIFRKKKKKVNAQLRKIINLQSFDFFRSKKYWIYFLFHLLDQIIVARNRNKIQL